LLNFLRLPKRIKGLMLMLTIALQVLTFMDFVYRRKLEGEPISRLVPGNPKMKTNRLTAERLLSQCDNLFLLIEEKRKRFRHYNMSLTLDVQVFSPNFLGCPSSRAQRSGDPESRMTEEAHGFPFSRE
ncbi:MAG: hypothetical protein MUD09_09870, partial [Desulfobacterales bacterium]|nr:hypothetical protein [Desulfobacterales bacterium]